MFGFGKKAKAPEGRLADLQRKKDWPEMSKTYYELGVAAMDAGELHKAQLWLHRADTIYSADNDIYDDVGEKITDDCSSRIGRLEDEDGLFYNAVPAEIEARAEELPGVKSSIVGCALLPDYYVRTSTDRLEDVPQIRAELQRIWSDYDFVRSGLAWEEIGKRIADYKQLDILA